MTSDALAELYALACGPETAWMDWAVCPEVDPDLWFPNEGQKPFAAKTVCADCPVISECLAYALEHDLTGVWGGTTETERELMARPTRAPAGLVLAA